MGLEIRSIYELCVWKGERIWDYLYLERMEVGGRDLGLEKLLSKLIN